METQNTVSLADHLSHLYSREQWIQQSISLADQKAQVLIALNSALVAGLHAAHVLEPDARVAFPLALAATVMLALAILFAVLVISPRGTRLLEGRVSNPLTLSSLTGDTLADELAKLGGEALRRDLAAFVCSMARINRAKYLLLPKALWSSYAGWALGAVAAVVAAAA